jgi:nucleoside-triphosphatase THEP1
MPSPSHVAVIANHAGLDSQALLAKAAGQWRASGVKVVGVLAENNEIAGECSAGFVRDIASGQPFSVHLDAPPKGQTCHLDAGGMEGAGSGLLAQIPAADVVIFSKFGKLEAMQGGLWMAFAAAMAAGKPLLTTVSSKHFDAWREVAPHALWLEGETQAIEDWWCAQRRVES